MLPIQDGSYVTGEFVQDWNFVRSHHAYIVITKEDGVVFKVLENKIKESGKFIMHSLNPLYLPYEMPVSEIVEIWKFVNYISSEMPEANKEKDQLMQEVKQLKEQVKAIQMKLNL
jgi:FtsZ-binding cell division protein ZapB